MTRAFINGKFYMNAGQFAEAVLSEDGVITAVGTTNDILAAANGCEAVDLGGRTVLPGFNDSHCHLYGVGEALTSLMMDKCTSIADCIETGRAYIQKNAVPAGKVIKGRGWNQDYFTDENRLLDRHDLDKISTEHAIVVRRACGHILSCNTFALKKAGIDRNTPDVDGGEIRKDENGEPNGIFSENALAIFNNIDEAPTKEEMTKILKAAMEYASHYGITSVQTNDVKDDNAEMMLEVYNSLSESGEAIVRAYHQCCFTNIDRFRRFAASGYKTGKGSDMTKIGPLKLFVDGSLGARTALTRKPYNDDPTTTGVECMTQEQLDEIVEAANDAGFQVLVHAIGDGAIEMVLNSYEKTIGGGENKNRLGINHVQITDVPMLERFRNSDILAHVQPIFLHYDMKIVEDRVGKELASTSYAFNTMNELGLHVSYGTDSPVEDLSSMNNIHCAVNRQDLKKMPESGFYPNECVTLEETIDNYTIGSAYSSFDEQKKGRIQPGFLADMCVLDKDIFTIPSSDIMSVNVDMTILGGKTVYTR